MGQEVFDRNLPKQWRFFAIDADGIGWFYSAVPDLMANKWDCNYINSMFAGTFDITGIDWKTTLIERQNPAQ